MAVTLAVLLALPPGAEAASPDISGQKVAYQDFGSGLWLYDLGSRRHELAKETDQSNLITTPRDPTFTGSRLYYSRIVGSAPIGNYDTASIVRLSAYEFGSSPPRTVDVVDYHGSIDNLDGDDNSLAYVAHPAQGCGAFGFCPSDRGRVFEDNATDDAGPSPVTPEEPETAITPTRGACMGPVAIDGRWLAWADDDGSYNGNYNGCSSKRTVYVKDLATGVIRTLVAEVRLSQLFLDNGRLLLTQENDEGRGGTLFDLSANTSSRFELAHGPGYVTDFRGDSVVYGGQGPQGSGYGDRSTVFVRELSAGREYQVGGWDQENGTSYSGRISGDWVVYYKGFGDDAGVRARNLRTNALRIITPRNLPPPPRPVRNYVALGDSVAAGEGIGYGFEWRTDPIDQWVKPRPTKWLENYPRTGDDPDPGNFCHQTPQAHPYEVQRELRAPSLVHLACTGSTASDGVLGDRKDGKESKTAPQLRGGNSPYGNSDPDVVTLSLGANDLGFPGEVSRCYDPRYILGCHSPPAYDEVERKLREDVAVGLTATLSAVRRIGDDEGKRPLVALTQYYDPFGPSWDTNKRCVDIDPGRPGSVGLSAGEFNYLRHGLKRLNETLAEVAREFPNVVLVPPSREIAEEHYWCSPKGPWVHGPSIATGGFEKGLDNPAPFHPTTEGQGAIARAVTSSLRGAQQVSAGSDVEVETGNGITLRFSDVARAGSATAAPLGSEQAAPNTAFKLQGGAFDVATSASWSGQVTVSLPSATARELYHYTEGAWRRVPSRFGNGYVTGSVSSLSPFALGVPVPVVSASFTSSGGGTAPAAVSFDAAASGVESGSIVSYVWDFGDGSAGAGGAPSHTYETSGTYEVRLRTTSDQGAVDEATRTVTVTNIAPTAALAAPSSAQPGERVAFDAGGSSDENGSVTDRVWDFGDGSELVEGERVTHAYSEPGDYTVTLTVLDDEGEADSQTAAIRVADTIAPQTTIDSGPTGATADATPQFTFSSSEAASSFECRVDAAAFSACSSPHTTAPLSEGAHTFEVRATDTAGNPDATPATRTLTVDTVAPQTTIDSGPTGATADATPQFTFSSSEAASSFECRVDAAAFSACSSPHTTAPLSEGAHTFEVRATDAAGNLDATPATRTLTVATPSMPAPAPVLAPTPLFTPLPAPQPNPPQRSTRKPGKCSKLRAKKRAACIRKRCAKLKGVKRKRCIKKVTRRH